MEQLSNQCVRGARDGIAKPMAAICPAPIMIPPFASAQDGTPGSLGRLLAFAILTVICISVPATAQTQERKSDSLTQQSGASMAGRVLNAITKQPIENATVTLYPYGSRIPARELTTNGAGGFSAGDLEAGQYLISANKDGFVIQYYGARQGQGRGQLGLPVVIAPGHDLSQTTILLTPQGVITGKVRNSDGQPLRNVRVEALRQTFYKGALTLAASGYSTSTNDLGEYRLPGLGPATYLLVVSPCVSIVSCEDRGVVHLPNGSHMAYPVTFFPSAKEPTQGQTIQLRGGDDLRGNDFQVERVPVYRVDGKVTGAPEQIKLAAYFRPEIEGALAVNRQISQLEPASERFQFRGVASGRYELYLVDAITGQPQSEKRKVTVSDQNVELELNVISPRDIQGKLATVPDEHPSTCGGSGESKSGAPQADPTSGRLAQGVIFESASFTEVPARRFPVDAANSFTAMGLAVDDYTINVTGLPPCAYIKSMIVDRKPTSPDSLNLSADAHQIQLIISLLGGRIVGTLLDKQGNPVPRGLVSIVSRSSNPTIKGAVADQFGNFAINGLQPGDYRLYGWANFDYGAHLSPQIVAKYGSNSQDCDLASSKECTVRILATEMQ